MREIATMAALFYRKGNTAQRYNNGVTVQRWVGKLTPAAAGGTADVGEVGDVPTEWIFQLYQNVSGKRRPDLTRAPSSPAWSSRRAAQGVRPRVAVARRSTRACPST